MRVLTGSSPEAASVANDAARRALLTVLTSLVLLFGKTGATRLTRAVGQRF